MTDSITNQPVWAANLELQGTQIYLKLDGVCKLTKTKKKEKKEKKDKIRKLMQIEFNYAKKVSKVEYLGRNRFSNIER